MSLTLILFLWSVLLIIINYNHGLKVSVFTNDVTNCSKIKLIIRNIWIELKLNTYIIYFKN